MTFKDALAKVEFDRPKGLPDRVVRCTLCHKLVGEDSILMDEHRRREALRLFYEERKKVKNGKHE